VKLPDDELEKIGWLVQKAGLKQSAEADVVWSA
jgi:hypothetical protein